MSTVLLLNGGSLVDATGRHTLTANDGTVTSSGGMLSFDGASSLRVDDNLSDFAFAGAFTIEGQINGVTAGAATELFLSNYDGNGGTWEMFTRGSPSFNGGFWGPSGVFLDPTGTPWVTDSLHDWAFTYDPTGGGASRLYLDGVKIAEAGGNGSYVPAVPPPLYIGRENSTSSKFFKGLLRVRIDNGVALYTGNSYTPPAWPIVTAASLSASQTTAQAEQAATVASVARASADQSTAQPAQTATLSARAAITAAQTSAQAAQVATLVVQASAAASLAAAQLARPSAQLARFARPYVFERNERTWNVAAQDRAIELGAQDRANVVPPEDRTIYLTATP